jgi:hypothetical protein
MDISTFLKFIYFWEISTLILSYVEPVKSKVEIWQNFVAFSEYVYELYFKMSWADQRPIRN